MTRLNKTVLGALLILIQAAVFGLAMNTFSPRPLPWVRVSLRQTHKTADSRTVRGVNPPPSTLPTSPDTKHEPSAVPKIEKKPVVASTPKPFPTKKVKQQVSAHPAKQVEALFTTLPDAKALFDKKAAIFVDSRHRDDYDIEHIPGALSLYYEDLDKLYDRELGTIPKDKAIVTYCSDPQCETAIKLADALVARGHTRVFILLEGLPGWKDAGYPAKMGEANESAN